MPAKLFLTPFAKNGDVLPIPDARQSDGSVSYDAGFGPDYDRQLGVDPQAKNIARGNFNQVISSITLALQETQSGVGTPPFSATLAASLPGGGYGLGAIIPQSSGTGLWVSTLANNANNPDTGGAGWVAISSARVDYAVGAGTANVQTAVYTPALPTTDGTIAKFKAIATNTAAMTFNGTPVLGGGGQALQGGEVVANGLVTLCLFGGNWVVISTTGALQVSPATKSLQAVQLGQLPSLVSGVVGQARTVRISITAASVTATVTADEIIVETGLGGSRYCLPGFSKVIDLSAGTGIGKMDTGIAPVSGAVGVYAIYNPNAVLSPTNPALLAVNASSARVPEICAGVMPVGYTASALIAILQTNASSQFPILFMEDRHVSIVPTQILNTTTAAPSYTALVMPAVPNNAISVDITWLMTSGGSASLNFATAASAASLNAIGPSLQLTSGALTASGGYATQPLITPKTTYYTFGAAGGATLAAFNIGYRF